MWQSLLLWLLAIVVMILYLPVHLFLLLLRYFVQDSSTSRPSSPHGEKGILSRFVAFIAGDKNALATAPTPLKPTKAPDSIMVHIKTKAGLDYTLHTRVYRGPAKRQRRRSSQILLLHGAYCDSGMWANVAAQLAHTTHADIFALDLPGFGDSTMDSRLLDMSVDDTCQELQDVMGRYIGKMGLRHFVLVGYSFGGFVASLVVSHQKHKHHVHRCLFIAPAGFFPLGARWAHLHAIVFRLKMLSMLAPDLQSQGENLIMKFFNTSITGSRWLRPALASVLQSGVDCRFLSGSQDNIFNVEQALLIEELSLGFWPTRIVPMGTHYIYGYPHMEEAVVSEVLCMIGGPRKTPVARKRRYKQRLSQRYMALMTAELKEMDLQKYTTNTETWKNSTESFAKEILGASKRCASKLKRAKRFPLKDQWSPRK